MLTNEQLAEIREQLEEMKRSSWAYVAFVESREESLPVRDSLAALLAEVDELRAINAAWAKRTERADKWKEEAVGLLLEAQDDSCELAAQWQGSAGNDDIADHYTQQAKAIAALLAEAD
jgi:hypothetical protein